MYIGNDPSSTTSSANYNIAVGTNTLDAITTGDDNVGIGYNALTANTTGSNNTAVGMSALRYSTTGVHREAQLYAKDWGFNIKNIKKKIFIWHGASDLTVPISITNYYKAKLKNKKIYIKSNEGHFSICYNFMNKIIKKISE